MFSDLVNFEPETDAPGAFTPTKKVDAKTLLEAQTATVQWLEELGVPPDDALDAKEQTQAAREAFTSMVVDSGNSDETRARMAELKTPAAVQHLTGMLLAYDWEFVKLAKELRGYTVAKIVEETQSNNPNIRLKALQMLGKVTEVGLFTDKVEITKKDASEAEIDERLRARLEKYMGAVEMVDAQDISMPSDTMTALPNPTPSQDLTLDEEISQVAEVRSSE